MSRQSLLSALLLQLSLLFSLLNLSFAQQCWFPDGVTVSPGDTPCQNTTSGEHTACCGLQADGSRAYCLSNGLCWGNMIVSRGSCTDQSWKSGACGQYCLGTPASGVIMTPCSQNTWGCAFECGTNTFHVSTGTLQISEANYAELEIDNGTATLASSASAPTPTPAAATMSAINEPTNPVATACTIASPPKSNVNIVGIGVGVPIGLAFAITALLFLNERRKLLKLRRARVLIHDRKPAQMVYQASDPAKLQHSQSYRSQLPYQQSYQPPYPGPFSADTFPEAGPSPGPEEKPSEKKTLQELP